MKNLNVKAMEYKDGFLKYYNMSKSLI